ncbi:hypothetical protein LC653_15335 [Nostoc sp. CHAB 5784]|uniref:hypothetical protein n=1 Tax=Nostoc mirabile TaxID=2907820 RepID=UPI001E6178AE|nr:hypothetical protein [Nostoc mirabile]MCC5665252.1 hypothetical protein [Nostoc mirabile CHAB5784]
MKKNNLSAPESTTTSLEVRRFRLSFVYAVPIGLLGGLIGLGGAEFRLPVLAGKLGYSVRQAVPLNLAISLITIAASLVIRGSTLSFSPVIPLFYLLIIKKIAPP